MLTLLDKQFFDNVEGLLVFTDRFYISMELVTAPYKMKVHLSDTINRTRKGFPSNVKKKEKNENLKHMLLSESINGRIRSHHNVNSI